MPQVVDLSLSYTDLYERVETVPVTVYQNATVSGNLAFAPSFLKVA